MAAKKEKPIRRTTSGKGANYRKTKSGAGMTEKGVKEYRKKNPGSKLQTAVTTVMTLWQLPSTLRTGAVTSSFAECVI